MMKQSKQAENSYVILSLLVVTAMGFFFKYYTGWGKQWFNNSFSTIFYEILWCLVAFWFFRSDKAVRLIPIWVFLITCVLEFLQLWHPPLLEQIRATLIGRLLLGTTFVWSDFIYYAVGSVCGWLWLKSCKR
jgi:hypothetical protein